MPYVDNKGIHIHYETEGEGSPLVLLHGFCGAIEYWYDAGYVAALKPEYRLVLLDLRGHGANSGPHDPQAYRLELLASDVAAVLDDLGIARSHCWGYSMGGRVA